VAAFTSTVFLFGLSDAPIQFVVAVISAIDQFLKSCGRFWMHPWNIVHHLCMMPVFLLYIFCLF